MFTHKCTLHHIRSFCEILIVMQDLDVFDICSYLLILNCKFSS